MVALKSSYSWKYCPSVCWVRLLVAAEALNFPLVSELALLAGSHFHLFFSWRQEYGAKTLSLVYVLQGSGTDLLCCFCVGFHQNCAMILGTDAVFPSHRGLGASMGWEMGGTEAWWCDKFGRPFVSELYGSGVFLASHPDNALHLSLCLTRALGPFL